MINNEGSFSRNRELDILNDNNVICFFVFLSIRALKSDHFNFFFCLLIFASCFFFLFLFILVFFFFHSKHEFRVRQSKISRTTQKLNSGAKKALQGAGPLFFCLCV